ncbi:MAG: hypothetical protein ABI895_43160 [Deltaproteobacteria bacterium]
MRPIKALDWTVARPSALPTMPVKSVVDCADTEGVQCTQDARPRAGLDPGNSQLRRVASAWRCLASWSSAVRNTRWPR